MTNIFHVSIEEYTVVVYNVGPNVCLVYSVFPAVVGAKDGYSSDEKVFECAAIDFPELVALVVGL